MTEIDEKGGYDVEFVGNEPHNVTCCICLLVLREPMQAEQCGHRFCESCVEDLKNSQNGKIVCPEDREVINVFKDKGKKREILNLIVKCSNHQQGCTVTKELRDLQGHLKNCAFQLIQCPFENCKIQLQRDLLAKHKMEGHSGDRVEFLERRFEQALQKIEEQGQKLNSQSKKPQNQTEQIELQAQENENQSRKLELQAKRVENLSKKLDFQKQEMLTHSLEIQLKSQEIGRLNETIKSIKDYHAANQVFCNSYVWKVNQFERKFENAKYYYEDEPQMRIFFTSKGYCMTNFLYLNGNDYNWNQFLTLEFVLEEGAFDDSLKRPMRAVITVSLIYKNGAVDTRSIDTKAIPRDKFHRPNGSFKSYALALTDVDKLYNYCANDAITIKIEISHY